MKTKLQVALLLFIAQLFLIPLASRAADDSRDGNWWLDQSKAIKQGYMIGFLDGIQLGKKFSYWNFIDDPQSESCLHKVAISTREYETKYLSKVKVGQLVDGLDDFYSDYRNRGISTNNAIWLVLNGIAGTPKEKLDKMIEAFRRNPNI